MYQSDGVGDGNAWEGTGGGGGGVGGESGGGGWGAEGARERGSVATTKIKVAHSEQTSTLCQKESGQTVLAQSHVGERG